MCTNRVSLDGITRCVHILMVLFRSIFMSPESHMKSVLAQSLKLASSMSCLYLFQAEEDPLFWHGGFRTRHSFVLLESCDYAVNNLPNITIPVLVLQGSADKLVILNVSISPNVSVIRSSNVKRLLCSSFYVYRTMCLRCAPVSLVCYENTPPDQLTEDLEFRLQP